MAREIGRLGQYRYGSYGSGSIFFEEFLPELRGTRGVQAYTEMADNDATVGAILFAIVNSTWGLPGAAKRTARRRSLWKAV